MRINIDALAEIELCLAKARLGEQLGGDELPYEGDEQPWLVPAPAELVLH